MFKHIALTRPLAVIDLETTGTNAQTDRIVEISLLRVGPGGERQHKTQRLDPTVPIPAEATAVHGITDEDVAGEPRFKDAARELVLLLEGCDLCGFNLKRFDLRMLAAEFRRAGVELDLAGRAIVDPMQIFHHYERRDLAAAVAFFLGREHAEAHTAASDVLATAEVLDAMVGRYADMPTTPAELHQRIGDSDAVDSGDRFVRVEGQIRFRFGKYRGQPLAAVARNSPDYLRWMLDKDFADDTKKIVAEALRGP